MSDTPLPVETVVLETTSPAFVDWSSADMWRVIVTVRGVPCSAFWLPGPGRLWDPDSFTQLVISTGRERLAYDALFERFRKRLGVHNAPPVEHTCSVVVCTHRRSTYLPGLLEAITRLDPAPDEVIVVDNDPGELDCRDLVEAVGARYLREDRRGLDNARNAGLKAARSDLVAFTDDDCIPAPGWLAGLDELFGDRSVGAVTGPAFAYELRSPAQVRFERQGGFTRGPLQRRRLDWTMMSPLNAGAAGAGANMVFRRDVLGELGVVFPPELDAGTPTESGGDMYALYKVLAAGWRVVYDPGTYVLHRHRRTPEALHRAFFGYGVGLSAAMAKILIEEREPDAVRTWWWLVSQYRATQRDRALGRADAREVRVAWDYLRGGVHGPRALLWARSIAREASAGRAQADIRETRRPARVPGAAWASKRPRSDESPALSVIVPTRGRPGPLARCLEALAEQDVEAPFEIVVIDDDPVQRPEGPVAPSGLTFRVIHSGGCGAAAARNAGSRSATGDVLLFLDDDLVPAPDLVRRHLGHHRGESDRIVIGRCPPRPPRRSLTDSAAALWWHDRYRDMAASAALTFTDVLSGNASIRRTRFLSLGGFDERLGTLRREDWHWGIEALKAGMAIAFDPDAVAAHEFVLTPARRLAAAYAEGRGDALLARDHPELIHALPYVDTAKRRVKYVVVAQALRRQHLRRVVIDMLDALERARFRQTWFRLFQAAQAIEYARGRGVDPERPLGSPHPALVIDPDCDEPLPPPEICAPRLRLETDEDAIALTPDAGRWNANVAASLAAACENDVRPQRLPRRTRPAQPVTLLVGPGHRLQDRKRLLELGGRGAEVRCYEGPMVAHWAALDRLIRSATTDIVATVIPGTLVEPRWLDEVSASLDGDRLALAIGAPADESEEDTDAWLVTRFEVLPRYPIIGRPFGYIALRRAHYLDLGGFDRSAMRFGHYAPSLELAERALDRGLVVVHRNLTQMRRRPVSRNPVLRPEWQRQRARGALLARNDPASEASRILGVARGAAPLAGALVHRRSPSVKALGALSAYVLGVAEGVRATQKRSADQSAAGVPYVAFRRSQRLDPGLSLAGGRLSASASPWRAAMKELKKTISHAELNIRKAWMR